MINPTCGDLGNGVACKWYYPDSPSSTGGECESNGCAREGDDPACALVRHLTACQATVDMVHRLLGTESVTEIQGRIAELEAERTRKDKGE